MGNRALVIGAADYSNDPDPKSYDSIRESARGYKRVIEQNAMWSRGACELLEDPMTNGEVWDALSAVAKDLTEQDRLLVVYVGHGQYWKDVPDCNVHFALRSSVRDDPTTWLNTWYLYWKMRKTTAGLKVLIVDSCYSNRLGSLGPEAGLASLLRPPRGTAVLTALGGVGTRDQHTADPEGCPRLEPPWSTYTLFSGHLLKILDNGTEGGGELTLGGMRDAVETAMAKCGGHDNQMPRLISDDAPEDQPLFANQPPKGKAPVQPSPPTSRDGWVEVLSRERHRELTGLLTSAADSAFVESRLRALDTEISRHNARRISQEADKWPDPLKFVSYQAELRAAVRA